MEGLGDRVEALKTREHARLMTTWMGEALPDVAEVMIRRRDVIMANCLRERCGDGQVVAVVGMAREVRQQWRDWEIGSRH
mmetsp:Transcript_52655/g.157737  ORF Transcript_52655/g.157737 Transcript_52655/m.157737 type:complete len:80 (-) Transcript_52655:157-396(-)